METLVVLLSITVILLSIVVLALLTVSILVVIKINRIAKRVDTVTNNLASASDWLSPVKVFAGAVSAFQSFKK